MRINHNITALNTYRQLSANSASQGKSIEKLSSGLRINRAGDDAAGLAISEKMRGQIRGLEQASRNAQDGISMIQTSEGALNETHSILQRMKELATQASNGTNTDDDRGEIQKEINQLTSEINRIGNTTEFNAQKLLDGGGSKAANKSVMETAEGGEAGNVSTVSTLTVSQTGKALTNLVLADGSTLSIEAADTGKTLNGITFSFTDSGAGGAVDSVTRVGNAVTIDADFTTGITAAELQTALNTSGAVPEDFSVKLTSAAGANVAGDITTATHAIGGKTASATAGGLDAEVRGTFSFDVSQAFANENETFTLKVPTAATPNSFSTITLTSKYGANVVANNGHFSIGSATDISSAEQQAAAIRDELMNSASTAYIGDTYDVSVSQGKITLTEKVGQTQGMAVEKGTVTSAAKAGTSTYTHTSASIVDVGGKFEIDGVSINVVDGNGENDAVDVAAGKAVLFSSTDTAAQQATKLGTAITNNTTLNQKYSVADDAAGKLTFTQLAGQQSDQEVQIKTYDKAGDGFEAIFQIGANAGQSLTIQVSDMRSKALGISGDTSSGSKIASDGKTASFVALSDVTNGTDNTNVEYSLDVSTHETASAAISVIDDAIKAVSGERSKLGAYQNRLEHTINNLNTSNENLTAAESRIRDVDMAKEMMEQTKNSILAQAAQAMLAQANQQPQGVLQLLR